MKPRVRVALAILCCMAGTAPGQDAGMFKGSADLAKWKLVWSDEFNYQGAPDPAKWGMEEGFIRNNEPQFYTRGRLENARVENGSLIIEARKEPFRNPGFGPVSSAKAAPRSHQEFAKFTSASLTTQDKASWLYGRFEIRAKMPVARGTWPAFWTLGENISRVSWPACGEIDIMEFWGRMPRSVTSTAHYRQAGKHQSDGGKLESAEPLNTFHVYALEWFPDHMDFFYDGVRYHTVALSKMDDNGQNAFRKPHFIILNLALENKGLDEASLPQCLVVDYVRIYQTRSTQ